MQHYLTKAELEELDILIAQSERYPTLLQFVKLAWPVIEPGTIYKHGWHIEAICEHLEAVSSGEIRKLVINMPPRHAKSTIVSVLWPCWEWIYRPYIKWLYASYAQSLSTRDSLKCRRLILSPWYQSLYGSVFQLTQDQRAKMRFDNNCMGYRISTSVGGVGTGEGGDRIVSDDPNNVNESESQTVRESTNTWWCESMSTRGNDPKKAAYVIVQQRTNERDLTGCVLEQGGYDLLLLPAEYEGKKLYTSIGWCDPREEEGELLWPEHFDRESIEGLKKALGSYAAAGQLQQRPSPREGGIIKHDWWCYFEPEYDEYRNVISPAFHYVVQSWDTAFKEGKTNDYCHGTTWGINNSGAYLINVIRKKMDFPTLIRTIKSSAKEYRPSKILIEDAASGQSAIQTLKKETKLPIKAISVDKDKETRLYAVSPFIESGRVFLLKGANWLEEYQHELEVFPAGRNDDAVDGTTQALAEIFLAGKTNRIENFSIFNR